MMIFGSLIREQLVILPTEDLAMLAFVIFQVNPEGISYDRYLEFIYNTFYINGRPNMSIIRQVTPAPISTILHYFASKLEQMNCLIYTTQTQSISNQKIFTRVIPPGNEAILDEGIIYRRGFYHSTRKQYNYSLNQHNDDYQFIYHQITIDPSIAIDRGYRFETRCCKMEPMEYIANKIGIAMNGTYFDLLNTYRARGEYRQYWESENIYYETNLSLSQIYKKYYGWVVLNNDKLSIEQSQPNTRIKEGFMAGPILVWDREIIFNEEVLERTTNIQGKNVKIFQCQLPGPLNRKLIPIPGEETYTFNCDQIYSSELAHASNPNPRTMLLITNQGHIIFVIVEGRKSSSSGADLVELANLAYQMGAIRAINLDGGRSSNLAWHMEGDTNIYTTNRLTSYVVGNIVSLVK
jgi:hypothetical protein